MLSRSLWVEGRREAIRNAFIAFRENMEYGRGTIAIRLPAGLVRELGGDAGVEPRMRVAPGRHARAMKRLTDLATAAELGKRYLGLKPSAVILEYLAGAAGGLDHYSAFLTGDQLRDVYAQIDGNFVGLGIELKAEAKTLSIVRVIPGSPAEKAGIVDNLL